MSLNHSVKQNFIPLFEVKNVLLIAALALGAGNAAQAQNSAASPPKSAAPQSQMAPSEIAPSQAAPSGATAAGPAKKATTQELEAAFKQTDADGDGKLSKKEAETFPELLQRFSQIDTDHDSFISSKEFMKAAGG